MSQQTTSTTDKTIVEPVRETPVLLETDVVVVGGGTTGPIAAISAARQGAKVVLIERFGCLGGMMTLGLNTKPSGALMGGLPLELWDAARAVGAAGQDYTAKLKKGELRLTANADAEMLKILLAKMCRDSGVQVLFETLVSCPVVEDGNIKGVIVESKSGRQFVGAKVIIDCSADGDIAAMAGAPFITGTGEKEKIMQPVSMYFMMRNVDIGALATWARKHPEEAPDRHVPETDEELSNSLWLTGFNRMLQDFQKRTGIALQRENITLKTANNELYVNATRVLGASGLSVLDISDAIFECYRQIEAVAKFLKEDVPGFENANIGTISPVLGVRETRHILGEYILTGSDVTGGGRFEDSIALDASAYDVHEANGADLDFRNFGTYEIPYRCLIPQKIEQLLVAGRCISTDHLAHARTRNLPACMATGQAAGVAAGISIKAGTTVRFVSVEKIQQALRKVGMALHPEELRPTD